MKPKHAFLPLLTITTILLLCPAAFALVEWSVKQSLEMDTEPVDVAVSPRGKWVFVLNDRGEILVYSQTGQLKEKIPIGTDFDQIGMGPVENLLYLSSRKSKRVEVLEIDFIYDVPTAGSPSRGPADAPVVIAVFSDYQ